MSMKGKFKFEGDGGKLFSLFFIQGLLTVITCGIYYAWAMAKILDYLTDCVSLDSKKFKFTGKGADIFSLFLIQGILTVVTCGIYAPFATLKIRKFFTEHVTLDDKAFAFSDDDGCDFWCLLFVQSILITITCGIYYPWALIKITKNILERTSYEGEKFSLTAEGGKLFSLMFVQGLLTVITCGIYGPWAMAKIANYLVGCMTIGSGKFDLALEGGELFSLFLVHGAILCTITCGIYTPWFMVKYYDYYCGKMSIA